MSYKEIRAQELSELSISDLKAILDILKTTCKSDTFMDILTDDQVKALNSNVMNHLSYRLTMLGIAY